MQIKARRSLCGAAEGEARKTLFQADTIFSKNVFRKNNDCWVVSRSNKASDILANDAGFVV